MQTAVRDTMAEDPFGGKLRCPACRADLRRDAGAVVCTACGHAYPVHGYGPDLMVPSLAVEHPAFHSWASVQEALARWRQRTWDGSAAAASRTQETRDRAMRFLATLGTPGDVIDIGCGSGWIRELMPRAASYTGLDPCPLADRFPFPFARAVSDRLPIADESYDMCLFFSSLDYSLAVEASLAEAHRVLRPGGVIAIATPIHASRTPDGERLHHHRFLAGELEVRVEEVFGERPDTWAARENYHFVQARKGSRL